MQLGIWIAEEDGSIVDMIEKPRIDQLVEMILKHHSETEDSESKTRGLVYKNPFQVIIKNEALHHFITGLTGTKAENGQGESLLEYYGSADRSPPSLFPTLGTALLAGKSEFEVENPNECPVESWRGMDSVEDQIALKGLIDKLFGKDGDYKVGLVNLGKGCIWSDIGYPSANLKDAQERAFTS